VTPAFASWPVIGAISVFRRISLYNGLIENEGLAARKQRFDPAVTKAETITIPSCLTVSSLTQKTSLGRPASKNSTPHCGRQNTGRSIDRTLHRRHGALTWEDAVERFSGAVEPCVARAKSGGVALVIENTRHSMPTCILPILCATP